MMDVTEHFTYEELTFSETALRLGVPNKPDAEEFIHLEYTAQQMEKVRSLLGVPIAVTSAFRSPYLNKLLGGAITSSHCYGLACDFKPIGLRLIAAAKTIEESNIKYDQLILEYGWIHLGFGALMRRESLTKRSKAAPYEKGLVL